MSAKIVANAAMFAVEQASDPQHRIYQAKAYVEERLIRRIDKFAARRGLTRSTAVRRLIISGLRVELMMERKAKEAAHSVEADLVRIRLAETESVHTA